MVENTSGVSAADTAQAEQRAKRMRTLVRVRGVGTVLTAMALVAGGYVIQDNHYNAGLEEARGGSPEAAVKSVNATLAYMGAVVSSDTHKRGLGDYGARELRLNCAKPDADFPASDWILSVSFDELSHKQEDKNGVVTKVSDGIIVNYATIDRHTSADGKLGESQHIRLAHTNRLGRSFYDKATAYARYEDQARGVDSVYSTDADDLTPMLNDTTMYRRLGRDDIKAVLRDAVAATQAIAEGKCDTPIPNAPALANN